MLTTPETTESEIIAAIEKSENRLKLKMIVIQHKSLILLQYDLLDYFALFE